VVRSLMVVACLVSGVASAQEATYRVDGARSHVGVLVKYDRNAAMAGHDHVLEATGLSGSVTFDPNNPATCAISLSFPTASLVVDPAGSRARAGLSGETSDGDKRKILENAIGKSQLDAASYPTISFQSSSCSGAAGKYTVAGTLKIHGRSKSVSTSMTITADGATLTAKGSFSATHADFGMEPFTALLGALRNDPNLKFLVDVTAAR
jgi:polyisoprenoid-binding protein YceI